MSHPWPGTRGTSPPRGGRFAGARVPSAAAAHRAETAAEASGAASMLATTAPAATDVINSRIMPGHPPWRPAVTAGPSQSPMWPAQTESTTGHPLDGQAPLRPERLRAPAAVSPCPGSPTATGRPVPMRMAECGRRRNLSIVHTSRPLIQDAASRPVPAGSSGSTECQPWRPRATSAARRPSRCPSSS